MPYVPSPVIRDELLFLVSDSGIASCVNARTGEVVWRERIDGEFFGSPVVVGARLYVISKAGELFVLNATENFEVLDRVELGDASFATPSIAGRTLYARTVSELIAIGE